MSIQKRVLNYKLFLSTCSSYVLIGIAVLSGIFFLSFPVSAAVPTITGVSPDTGSAVSTTSVTITGTNFEPGAKVSLLNAVPALVGSYDTPGQAKGVYVSGDYAYVADAGELQIINISDPSGPYFESSYSVSADSVYVSGNYAYVAGGGKLTIININDPASPSLEGSYDTLSYAKSVFISGDYAYVADGPSGLQIINISNPSSPYFEGAYNTPGDAKKVYVSGDYAYVADDNWNNGLQIINVSDPESPSFAGTNYNLKFIVGVYVSGDYAYVVDGGRLKIVDVSDPANPSIEGSLYSSDSYEHDVYVSGTYAYYAGYSWLKIINISDPASPSLEGTHDVPGGVYGVYVSGDYIYVAANNTGFQIIKHNNPIANITVVDSNTITAELPAGLPVGQYHIRVTNPGGEEAYLNNGFQSMSDRDGDGIFDDGDKSGTEGDNPCTGGNTLNCDDNCPDTPNPDQADADYDLKGDVCDNCPETVNADQLDEDDDDIGDVCDNCQDVSNAGQIDTDGDGFGNRCDNCLSVPNQDQSDRDNDGLGDDCDRCPDTADHSENDDEGNICELTITAISPDKGSVEFATNVTITGENFESGAKVSLLSGFFDPAASHDTPGSPNAVFVSGDYAYVADGYSGLQIINISDPTNLFLADSYDTSGEAKDVYVSGNYAYVADYSSGLQIINISDLTSLSLAGSYNTLGEAEGVYVSGDYAYIADNWKGLKIVNISDPATPFLAGSYDTPGYAYGVFVSGDYAYIADGYTGLQIINISDPATPFPVASYDTPTSSGDVYVLGDYAYVTGGSGFQIINISDPVHPYLLSSYDNIRGGDVYVSGDYAYVTDGFSGLQVINISDPTSPFLAGSYDMGSASGVYVSGDYAYVADYRSGLQIIKLNYPVTNITVVNSNTITATLPAGLLKGQYHILVTNPGEHIEEAYLYNAFHSMLELSDSDNDGILDNGDNRGTAGDNPCMSGNTLLCDDNCINTANPDQADTDRDGKGDACDNFVNALPENITYYVYGGQSFSTTENNWSDKGFHPENYGYDLLGMSDTTGTYTGAYEYYIITTYKNNMAAVDAIQGSDGLYFGESSYTGNTINYQNIGGPPDWNYASVGNNGFGGFITPVSSSDLSSITVFITSTRRMDTDGDSISDDGDGSETVGDNPCTGGDTIDCDDNCVEIPNADQADADGNGVGDVCEDTIFNPYDKNKDCEIEDFELLDAIDDWAKGNLDDFELLDLIDYWAKGSYC